MVMWQWLVGIGLGVIATLFTVNMAITSSQEQANRRSRVRKSSIFVQEPGSPCPICLNEMRSEDMHYLICLHAVHENCFTEIRRRNVTLCPICRTKIGA